MIRLAKSAGFCFGVNRAIQIINDLLSQNKKVCTLGPIIHNPQVVEKLESRGVRVVNSIDNIKNSNFVLVIRSHGVSQKTIEKIQNSNIIYVDATCPFVKKIHNIVKEESQKGCIVMIAGTKNHPEVEGITGNCPGEHYVFESSDELASILKKHPNFVEIPISFVAQTTFNRTEWKTCLKIVKRGCTNAKIFDTICNATLDRQTEAEEISKMSDSMIVIGGRCSSNTNKLKDICSKFCPTYLIETADEIPFHELRLSSSIGITAGASTPGEIIVEVEKKMDEMLNKENHQENMEDTGSFAEMLEESLKNFSTDDKVKGVVVGIAPNEVYVDVGRKQSGFIPLAELSNDSNVKPEDIVKVGDELELLIMRTNDQEGTIMLSKKRVDAAKAWDRIIEAADSGEIISGKVKSVVKGGIIVSSNGCNVFIPASHTSLRFHNNLDEFLNQEVKFKVIEVNKNKRRAVGSIKAVLEEEKNKIADKFWENVEIGQKYVGKVKSLTNYGAFVDLGGVDGMIHVSELSWTRIKHPSEIVKIGDTVEVYIKDLNRETRKISLGYKKTEDNPWEILKNNYKVGDIIDVQIISIAQFGAFARIIPGVDGLIHISQIADRKIDKIQDVLSVGDTVKAIIKEIDLDKKRVALSIRELEAKNEESIETESPVNESIETESSEISE